MTTIIDTTMTAGEIKPGMVYRYTMPRIEGGRDICDIKIRHVIPMSEDAVLVAGVYTGGDITRLRWDNSNQLLVNWYDEIPNDTQVTVLYSKEINQ
ncbi:hypothetical protein SEA_BRUTONGASTER_141 [Gordonia phage BrutonGaster]|uniref:Uncharacterized protein n=1 Tax=Gordonia phage BrutonGaster TaxID=2530116 RepID=A0A482JHE3_9CAUD|nr:hypothetical protein HOV26_gp041 [Gordonia phage BrutonGaster]QBP33355.1 hypothetical protein SEA_BRUTONGASTER_141 [Gordonia phage BrutonGaster]